MSDAPNLPPGPPGHFLVGSLPELRRDALGYMRRCERRYGSIFRLRMPWPIEELTVVADPALARTVFLEDIDSFQRSRWTRRMSSPILGNGLLLAEGDAWRRQRRLVQPAFHHERVAGYVDDIAACAEAMIASWSDGQPRDLYAEARALTVRVAARTLFGQTLGAEAERARTALEQAVAAFDRFKRSLLPLPLAVPTPAGLQLRRATRALDLLIYRTIAQRRENRERRVDLLSLLLDARDENGAPLTDREIRDEAITMFAGSTETSASALAWACYLLASHDDVMHRIRAEVAGVVGDGPVHLGHVARLGYVDKVVKETLRLYPPVWRTSREALNTYSLNGFAIRKGKQVVASQYLIHRNPRYFPDPERFDPARWSEDFTRSLPKFAYFPFGGGQRVCIGQAFATTVMTVTLATILARVRFETTAQKPEPKASTMLRPRAGVRLLVRRAPALGRGRSIASNGVS